MASIKNTLIKGALFNAVAKYYSMACNLVVVAVLARILAPDDFGVVAVTTVITAFFDLLADAGLGPAIIQSQDLEDQELSDIFTFSVFFAGVMVLLYGLCIWPLSLYYKVESLPNLLALLSAQLFFTTINVLPRSLMLKAKRFKELSIISVSNATICGVLSVLAAVLGWGLYSLIITPIGWALLSFVFCFIKCGKTLKIKLAVNFRPIRKLLNFSFYQFGFNFINYFSRNADKLLLGKYIGMAPLGYYEKSYRIMTLPLSSLSQVIAPTLQPVLSEYQSNISIISEAYKKISKYMLFIGCIVTPILFFCAREIILIIFGSQWEPAVPIFKVLSLSVLFQMLDSLSGGFLQSCNAFKYLFISGLICAIVNVGFLIIGLVVSDDIVVISGFVSLALAFNLFISVYYIVKLSFKESIKEFIVLFKVPLLLLCTNSALLSLLSSIHVSLMISLFIKITITVLVSLLIGEYTHFCSLKALSSFSKK